MNGGAADAPRLVAAQLDILKSQRRQLDTAIALLEHARRKLREGEEIGAGALCEIIKSGDCAVWEERWKKVIDRYYSPEQQAEWRERKLKAVEAAGFDQDAYTKAWKDLTARIEAAMPLSPRCDEAQAFVAEWNKLLEPFLCVATPAMQDAANGMWSRIEEWEHEVDTPVSASALKFIAQASAAGRANVRS